MSDQPDYTHLLNKLQAKYDALSEDTENYLEGLLYTEPITYWDYIHTDALLSLQIRRTSFPDEMVFIAYHQINELLFKMVLWEISQVAEKEDLSAKFFEAKLMRISRYFDMLTTSFDIMRQGMETEQYLSLIHI